MAKRPIGVAPRIVGKPLDGDEGTPRAERAEALKLELQKALQAAIDASDQLGEDVEDLQALVDALAGGSGIHPFFLGGM